MSKASASPCDDCGLCCENLLVMADATDVLREPRIEKERPLGKIHVNLTVLDANWLLAGPGAPCPFLNSERKCDIYPTRPQVCVAFVAGSSKCQELRERHGLSKLILKPAATRMLTRIIKAAIKEETHHPGLE